MSSTPAAAGARTGVDAGATITAGALGRPRLLTRVDARNLAVLVLGFAALPLLIPPVRDFSITDDWVYAQSLRDLLALAYKPHEAAQASALGSVAWGALFAWPMGFSFTTLSIANLVMAVIGVVLCYALLRQLQVGPAQAFLGGALLAFNPMYVYLSYTFMTDVAFLVYLLAGCLLYIRGVKEQKAGWLVLGGIAAALAYLTRQYGILLVPVVLAYMWWARMWTWRRAAAALVVPAFTVLAYMVWERGFEPRLSLVLSGQVISYLLANPMDFVAVRLQRDAWLLCALGLFVVPLLRRVRRMHLALILFGFIAVFELRSVQVYGATFPQNGNIVDMTGFVMFDYRAQPLWNRFVWVLVAVAGAFSVSLFLLPLVRQLRESCRPSVLRQRTADPVLIVYGLLAGLAVIILAVTPFVFDRYSLSVLPLLFLPVLRRLDARSARLRLLAVLPIALFSVIGQRDYMEHASVRWQAAEMLAAQGIPRNHIDAGFEWIEWYLYDEGVRYIRNSGDYTYAGYAGMAVLDPEYKVSDVPMSGYSVIGSFPYRSWLSGGEMRNVLQLKRK